MNFFCGKVIFAFTLLALATTVSAETFLVYFGTYTNALSQGIYVSRLDAATGKLSLPELAAETPNPCFINVSPDEKFLYAANGVKTFNGETAGAVSAFAIDKSSGKLTLLNQKSSSGGGPCHISVDATAKTLFVANYGGGSVKAVPLNKDGSLGDGGDFFQYSGGSANTNRQSSPHAHFMTADPSNRFALACDLGTDKVMIYILTDGMLTPNSPSFVTVPPGSGARHLAFSRNGNFIHVINEMACTITTFAWNANAGKLNPVETVSALPPGVAVQNRFTAAEILVHPSGKFVYATIRGHDSVSVLAADAQDGKLTFVQNVSAGGKVPRGLGIDPTGHWLITANQKSDNAVEFAIDVATGKLSPTGQELKIGAPVDVKFVH
jgi:6-phosphogluconolactonase